jgi:hypothetical protein
MKFFTLLLACQCVWSSLALNVTTGAEGAPGKNASILSCSDVRQPDACPPEYTCTLVPDSASNNATHYECLPSTLYYNKPSTLEKVLASIAVATLLLGAIGIAAFIFIRNRSIQSLTASPTSGGVGTAAVAAPLGCVGGACLGQIVGVALAMCICCAAKRSEADGPMYVQELQATGAVAGGLVGVAVGLSLAGAVNASAAPTTAATPNAPAVAV